MNNNFVKVVGILALTVLMCCIFGSMTTPQVRPMNESTAIAFQACLDKGWQPHYYTNGVVIDFTCEKCETDYDTEDTETKEEGGYQK